MAQQRRKRRLRSTGTKTNKQKTRCRLWLLLTLSVLFLVCILCDCYRKGFFQKEWREMTHQTPEPQKTSGEGKGDSQKVRVLLTNDAMNSIYHDTIRISGTEELVVSQNGSNRHFAKGKTVTYAVTGRNRLKDPIEISCPKGRIKVTSITRSGKNPVYRGSMKLVKKKQGILLVNTLTLREYLYGVVPSEMPSSYPMEALKAQAVCARSFAWRQIRSNSYKVYGADVDDTTNFQVYHMSGEDARTRKAVRSTAGQMVYSGDKVITTYYYSTSWGCSASEQEAWGGNAGKNYPIRFQRAGKTSRQSLLQESGFYDFITKDSTETYDSGYDWYRWQAKLPAETLGAKLGIGKAKKIGILKRGRSGLIRSLRVSGTKGRVTLEGQEKIRQQMYPAGTKILKSKSGEEVVLSMLPSAAFTVLDGTEDGNVVFTLIGGGLGHGVGMSQNGAGEMARQGKSYQEILKHYYSHCEIR